MILTLDNGQELSWQVGKNFFIVWHGKEYGFEYLEDAWSAYWTMVEERFTNFDGVFDKWGYSVEENC